MSDHETPSSNIEQDLITSTLVVGMSVSFNSLHGTLHWNVQFFVSGILWHNVWLSYGTMYFAYSVLLVVFSLIMADWMFSDHNKKKKEMYQNYKHWKKICFIWTFFLLFCEIKWRKKWNKLNKLKRWNKTQILLWNVLKETKKINMVYFANKMRVFFRMKSVWLIFIKCKIPGKINLIYFKITDTVTCMNVVHGNFDMNCI